jgi:hypothetical protein
MGSRGALGDWIGSTGFADDEGAEDNVAFDIEFAHDDADMRDIMLVTRDVYLTIIMNGRTEQAEAIINYELSIADRG